MIFALRGYRSPSPVPSLGGGTLRYKPVVPLTVIGPNGQATPFVLADSGSDDIVFPLALALQLGISLSGAPQRQGSGVGGSQPVPVVYAPVILFLTDGIDAYRWRAVVGFTTAHLRFPLFGIAGGWEHFRTTVDVASREILMLPQPSLPTTQDPVP